RLDVERARAALDQGDPPRDEAGEVGGLTPRARAGRGRRRDRDVDRLNLRGDVPAPRVLHRLELRALGEDTRSRRDARERRRRQLLEERKVELLDDRV